jgi:holliday junction DNA helicase RuvA
VIYSLTGLIKHIELDSVVIEVNGVGYQMFVSHPEQFTLNETITVYTHQVVREDDIYLIGFLNIDEKNIFLQLLSVKGIGPKTAIGALQATTPEQLQQAIINTDIAYLKKLPGIGPKAASQIVLDLKGQLIKIDKKDVHHNQDVIEGLLALGFKKRIIIEALSAIENSDKLSSEQLMRLLLQRLNK